jgi:hypothetical protein
MLALGQADDVIADYASPARCPDGAPPECANGVQTAVNQRTALPFSRLNYRPDDFPNTFKKQS